MERELNKRETQLIAKIQKLEKTNPTLIKNVEFFIDGILAGKKLDTSD